MSTPAPTTPATRTTRSTKPLLRALQPRDLVALLTGTASDRLIRSARSTAPAIRRWVARIGGLAPRADELGELLAAVLISDAGGARVAAEDLHRLRTLAVQQRSRDTNGIAIAALATLADRFDDSSAKAWLAPALAEAGRFTEAADRGPTFGPGRPRGLHYPIVVTALHRLGRGNEASQLASVLDNRFATVRQEFTHIWAPDPLGRSYRGLVEASASRSETLPVFQHLPFCAGSSMQFGLQLVVPRGRTVQIGRRSGRREIAALRAAAAQTVAELMLVHQHHPYALDVPGRELRHFTVLRDPVSQLRSGFYKRAAREQIVTTRDSRSATFEQHVEYLLAAGMTNLLARMIISTHPALRATYRRHRDRRPTPIRNEEDMLWLRSSRHFSEDELFGLARETLDKNFAVVGTMAQLQASHLACTAAVGVPYAALLGHRGRSGQPDQPTDTALETRLREANAVDQQLYEHYTERFVTEHAELITALDQ